MQLIEYLKGLCFLFVFFIQRQYKIFFTFVHSLTRRKNKNVWGKRILLIKLILR
ncbi:hypothetical protein C1645_784667 [Glomus cerebriforme]|uniref:Uncharacterized protein n=1 Tax=Glomus cerebriforme TaxID=658196 RepID=A0A397SD20_9GLOM|nr:hypothetical protein C1645_784667 [Glomus cerebriforme]